MNSTKSNKGVSLTADDVCKILDTCRSSGVAKFTFGAMEVDFRHNLVTHHLKDMPVVEPVVLEAQARVAAETIEREEIDIRSQQLDEALVNDPELYEELATKGDLVD